nr:hypothetical protein [Cellulosilyticum ruminicola]
MPQIRYIMNELKAKGMDIDTDVLTVEEAAAQITAYLRSGGKE